MSESKIEGMPDGWRLVAIRQVKTGEWFIGSNGYIEQWQGDLTEPSFNVHAVIEKIVTYRDVTPDDVGKMVEVHCGYEGWHNRKLLAVLPETFEYRYIYQTSNNKNWSYTSRPPRIKE